MCFVEIEMTDQDPRKAKIAEIAVFLTSGTLEDMLKVQSMVIYNGPNPETLIESEAVLDRFTKNGLLKDMLDPRVAIDVREAEELIIGQLQEYGIAKGSVPSAGIQSYSDRIILDKEMPMFNDYLSYT
jgi:oligoribonuclease (3'-5' exoribonuclease)